MRKFTLFLMSMFFMLGTSVAQDNGDGKDEGNAAFALEYSNPKDGENVFTVYNIRLKFNKDVVATLPEGGIDVKNNTTNEVVKITRLDNNEWLEKSEVVFLFEQKSVYDEKEGKEELKDQYIETPGQWSYTVPAGCIKSVDGEEFAEQTFTFNIASAMDIVSVSPVGEVTKLDKIEVTFPKAIASVNTGNLSLLDNYWMPASAFKSEVTYSDDRKTVTLELETPVTTPGTYNLDIYQGVFVSEDGALSNYKFVSFQVIDPTPSFSINLTNDAKLKELPEYLEITFKNVNEVELVDGADAVTVYMPGGADAVGTATLAGGKIVVTFDQPMTEDGDYTFVIPAGMFTMDGVENEAREITVELFTFTVTPLEIVSVTPEVGTVDAIERIVVKFNQPVYLSWTDDWMTQIAREIKLMCGEQEITLTHDSQASSQDALVYLVNAVWDGWVYASTPVTAQGTYTLDLSQIVVDYAGEHIPDEWGGYYEWHEKKGSCEGVCSWTIAENTAINGIDAENGEQVVYDLTGRRVKAITNAGIYIVNGKKVVVK